MRRGLGWSGVLLDLPKHRLASAKSQQPPQIGCHAELWTNSLRKIVDATRMAGDSSSKRGTDYGWLVGKEFL